jgi:hypothetical protein
MDPRVACLVVFLLVIVALFATVPRSFEGMEAKGADKAKAMAQIQAAIAGNTDNQKKLQQQIDAQPAGPPRQGGSGASGGAGPPRQGGSGASGGAGPPRQGGSGASGGGSCDVGQVVAKLDEINKSIQEMARNVAKSGAPQPDPPPPTAEEKKKQEDEALKDYGFT